MKTRTLLRGLVAAGMLAITGVSMNAQTWVTDAERDTVSTGSQARYRVDLYYNDIVNLPAVFNASGVNWTFPAGYTAANFTASDGLTALTTGADGAYNEKSIVMNAGVVASGLVLQAQEESRPITGTGCLAGNTTTITIDIVAMPTISYGADSGGCAAPATLPIPVNFTGYGKYDVRLNVAAYDLSNAAIGANQTVDYNDLVNVRTSQTAVAQRINLLLATLNAAAGGAIPAAGCYFDITSVNLQDRISQKHLGYTFNTTNVANANPDAADYYRFYVYAAPTTQSIQHIQNNY